MSLNSFERVQTSKELTLNLELAGLTHEQLASDLGYPAERLAAALAVDDADPVDVWELRDYLSQAVMDSGNRPVPFTVLTNASRRQAAIWFQLRAAPRHSFAP